MLECFAKEEITPSYHKIPIEIPTTYGVRLQIDSIVCEYENADKGNGIEIYGYLAAWSSFDYPEATLKENFEKFDKSLLWYRSHKEWIRLKEGESIPIERFTDFFFDADKIHQAYINLEFGLMEYDGGEGTWGETAPKNWFRYSLVSGSDEDEEYLKIGPVIEFPVEDIEFFDRVFENSYELTLDIDASSAPEDKQRIVVHYSFHPVTVRSVAKIPEGYAAGDEIIEPDVYPEIPNISGYASPPPARSEQLVVGQKMLSKFSPEPMTVHANNGLDYMSYGTNAKFVSGNQLIEPVFTEEVLPVGTELDLWKGLVRWYKGILSRSRDDVTGPKLESKPVIQMVRYWVPVNVKRIPAGTKLTTSTSITHGFDAGFTYSLSITTGVTVNSGIFSFNQQMQETFGFSFNYNYQKTVTETKEVLAPDDKNTVFVVWQLVEEFRVVDEEGKLFTDPHYDFKSMLIATIPTETIVEQAHQFSAGN